MSGVESAERPMPGIISLLPFKASNQGEAPSLCNPFETGHMSMHLRTVPEDWNPADSDIPVGAGVEGYRLVEGIGPIEVIILRDQDVRLAIVTALQDHPLIGEKFDERDHAYVFNMSSIKDIEGGIKIQIALFKHEKQQDSLDQTTLRRSASTLSLDSSRGITQIPL